MTISEFLGADFTNSPAAVSESMSPNCKNMIRDVPGKVRKCMGYETVSTYGGKINGCHMLSTGETVVHAGTQMYVGDVVKYSDANDSRSKSWQFNEKLYIIDGKNMLVFDGTDIKKATDDAYIPTLTIAKAPSGGGTQYEALNLLQSGFTEKFAGTESDTSYQLTFGELDATLVSVNIMDSDGNMVEKIENTDFTVDRANGIVNFTVAPGVSPVDGEDNVFITAYRTVDGYADRINKCTFGIQYGVGGAADRLFLSGNTDFKNHDWFSAQYDPTYFPDTGYGVLGSSNSSVVGYSVIGGYLAAHKDENETHQSIVIREGVLIENEPAFRIINTLQGAGAIAKDTFCYLCTEPLFLTRLGIYAITAQDVTGEKYAQNRSFYLNGKLLKEESLENAFAFVYKDMYWLCLNGVAYILDGLQPLSTTQNMPYATRQYVGFYRTNLPANCMWQKDGQLYFGTTDGKVCKFYSDDASLFSYNDNGERIEALWETPDLDGNLFYKNKTFRYMAIRLNTAISTSIKVLAMKSGLWNLIKEDSMTARYFTFAGLDFSHFTFSCDSTQKLISSKIRIKKVDKARFRLINNALNEPFGLYDVAFEFVEKGNHKG
ncbi:MAG: hypothetical protein UFG06_14040 [Lachnospiraceae bacterium]|nr:hypothetical protein [Lachnospiraceae bacterium]